MLEPEDGDETTLLNRILLQAYPVMNDRISITVKSSTDSVATAFDRHRNSYDFRREYGDYQIRKTGMSQDISRKLEIMGFELV